MKNVLPITPLIVAALVFTFLGSSAMAGIITHEDTWNISDSLKGVEVDDAGNVYVATFGTTGVLKYDSAGNSVATISNASLKNVVDVAVSPVDGSVYISTAITAGTSKAFYFSENSGVYSFANSWLQGDTGAGAESDSNGNMYVTNSGWMGKKINKYDPSDPSTPLASWDISGEKYLTGLAFNAAETIAYAVDLSTDKLLAIDLASGNTTDLASVNASSSWCSVAVDTDTGNIYVAERVANEVSEFAGDGTLLQTWDSWGDAGSAVSQSGANSFGTIFGIAFDTGLDRLYVTDQAGKVEVFGIGEVPEPSTWILLLTLGCLGFLGRRRLAA